MRHTFLVTLLILATLAGATALVTRGHDCADTTAGAFVYRNSLNAGATATALFSGHPALVQQHQLGTGVWACLAIEKQSELTVAGIHDDASLSRAVVVDRRDYQRADFLGTMPQVGHSPIRVYRLSRTVLTHELTTEPELPDWSRNYLPNWVKHHLPGRSSARLEAVKRTESILLLVRLDDQGKVDRFGFPAEDG